MARFPVCAIWVKVAMAVVIIAAVSVVGCGVKLNQLPTISSLIANPSTVAQGGSSTVTCTATDPDGDVLTYTWSATGGTVTGTGSVITWIAPGAVGTYTITVTVNDGNGGTATDDVVVTVTVSNSPPVISSVVPADSTVSPGGTTTVTCTATDADGDTLTYYWSASLGSISGTGNIVTWQAPMTQGIYSIQATVEDGNGGNDTGSTSVEVAVVVTAGSIDIQSSPPGAKVFLDGVDTHNITPYVITGVSAGSHTVMLRKNFYKDEQAAVVVPAGGTQYVNWALTYTAPVTVTIQPNAAAGKDTFIYQGTPNDNEGSYVSIYAAGALPNGLCRSFIEFDLSPVPSSSIVTDAKLGLYYYDDYGTAVDGPIGAYRITQSWDEMVLTWNIQPSSSATPAGTTTIPAFTSATWRYWDIDALAQGWVDGSVSNYGVMLRDTDESTEEGWKGFRSSDYGTAAQRPKLTIQYYDPVP